MGDTTRLSLSIVSIVPCPYRSTSHNLVVLPSERVDLLAAAGDNSANDPPQLTYCLPSEDRGAQDSSHGECRSLRGRATRGGWQNVQGTYTHRIDRVSLGDFLMVRVLSLATVLVAMSTTLGMAQIVSIPVVTSRPTDVGLTTYPMPAQPPVPLDACAPPVVTFCNPCATGGVAVAPVTTYYAPVTTFYAPTATYYAPRTAFRLPALNPFLRPATTTYYPPSVPYYGPAMSYRMPTPPEFSVFAPPTMIVPTTSYYAPTVSAPPAMSAPVMSAPIMSAPVNTGRSCGCGGR